MSVVCIKVLKYENRIMKEFIKETSFMRVRATLLIVCVLYSCHPSGQDQPIEIPIPTRLCIRTQHHDVLIPNANIFIRYNTDIYPGYEQPATYFDTTFQTNASANACLPAIPVGKHWLIAYGADMIGGQAIPVFGSMRLEIDLTGKAIIDTILYVSE
jgi:hypothetical protein